VVGQGGGFLIAQVAFQAAAYTFTDALNQILQLVFNRRFEALKSR